MGGAILADLQRGCIVMADVEVSYKGSTIGSLSASGTLTLETEGKYCEDDITVDYTSPGGGGGITKIADGTFTGAGNYTVDLSIGKKMPQTNFWFRLWLTPSSVLANAEKYSAIGLFFTVYSPDKYDLSTDGTKRPATTYSFSTDYNGVTTVCLPVLSRETVVFYRYANTESAQIASVNNTISITKSSAGFTVTPTLWNPNNLYASGLTYNWEIVYFGNDPTNDIVEVP